MGIHREMCDRWHLNMGFSYNTDLTDSRNFEKINNHQGSYRHKYVCPNSRRMHFKRSENANFIANIPLILQTEVQTYELLFHRGQSRRSI